MDEDNVLSLLKLEHLYNRVLVVDSTTNKSMIIGHLPYYSEILSGKVEYKTKGSNSLIYYVKVSRFSFCFKIIPVYGDNHESIINDKLNKIYKDHISPHLKIFFGSVNGNGLPLLNPNFEDIYSSSSISNSNSNSISTSTSTSASNSNLQTHLNLNANSNSKSSVIITEWIEGITLSEMLKNQMQLIEWKNLFFQILYGLASIQQTFQGFKHNDFASRNIIIKKINTRVPIIWNYLLKNQYYQLTNCGFQIKIIDFDLSYLPGIDNIKLQNDLCKEYGINTIHNDYYDIHHIFNEILMNIMKNNIFQLIPKAVRDLLTTIIPPDYYGVTNGERVKYGRLTDTEFALFTAKEILEMPFFDCFKFNGTIHQNDIIYKLS